VKLGHSGRPRSRTLDDALLPLVNVVFLLMVFFLSMGRFGAPPSAAAPRTSEAETKVGKARVLELREDGALASEGQTFAESDLAARAIRWAGEPLDVKAAGQVPAERVLRLLTVLRGVGVTDVRLLTVKPRAP